MAAAKARGVKLGGPNGLDGRRYSNGHVAVMNADIFAKRVRPAIIKLHDEGLSLRQIAGRLNEMQIRTARGGDWSSPQVMRILNREV